MASWSAKKISKPWTQLHSSAVKQNQIKGIWLWHRPCMGGRSPDARQPQGSLCRKVFHHISARCPDVPFNVGSLSNHTALIPSYNHPSLMAIWPTSRERCQQLLEIQQELCWQVWLQALSWEEIRQLGHTFCQATQHLHS